MRIILHIDMDAFFAAVEERDNPRFFGKPIVVGSDPKGGEGRGVVSTANYKAREYGIRSALPISSAWEFSERARKKGLPPAIFLGVNMEKYEDVSLRIRKILLQYTARIEQASIDEFYLDVSDLESYAHAMWCATLIQKEIKEREKISCSVGIASNKCIAKIASDFQKPNGFFVVFPEDTERFLESLPIRKIPGIGPKTEQFLQGKGIQYVRDVKQYSVHDLHSLLGKYGGDLFEKVRGVDTADVTELYEIKSIGDQETFERDTSDAGEIFGKMKDLVLRLHGRFLESDFKTFSRITITVRFGGFETKTRSLSLASPESELRVLEFESMKLLIPFLDNRENKQHKKIRLLGVRIEKLGKQKPLF